MKFSRNGSRHSSGSEDIHSEGSMVSRISFDEQIPSNYIPGGNTISNSIATWDFPSNQPGVKSNLNNICRTRVFNILSRKTVNHGTPYSPRNSNQNELYMPSNNVQTTNHTIMHNTMNNNNTMNDNITSSKTNNNNNTSHIENTISNINAMNTNNNINNNNPNEHHNISIMINNTAHQNTNSTQNIKSCSSSDCSTRSCASNEQYYHQKTLTPIEDGSDHMKPHNMKLLKKHSSNVLYLPVMNTPSVIEYGSLKFLIMDAPTNDNIGAYISELKRHNVKHVIRTCEKSYDDSKLLKSGIQVQEMVFTDGEAPPMELIENWLSFVYTHMDSAIAVHCVAGLGRGPVLVAIALIQLGMKPYEAVAYIRERRRGAINRRQLQYLESCKISHSKFRRQKCLKRCSIM